MYTAAVYNYFNSGRQARKPKCRNRKIAIPKPSKKRQINKCKLCGRKFLRLQDKQEADADIEKQSGNIVFEKVLLIWKYARNLLSNTAHGNDPQKCSFKIIAHKSYKKRSLHQEIVSTTSILSQICKICEKSKIQKNKCKELKTEEHKINGHVVTEHKCNNKRNGKKKKTKKLLVSNESDDTIQLDEYLRGKKRDKLCTKSSKSSIKIKEPKRKCISKTKTTAYKRVDSKKKKQKPKEPKKKLNTNKKKRMFPQENRKKVNRFASWQYLQHALSSVDEETITNYVNEDSTPVYLTFEEYCRILEAIDTQGSTDDKFSGGDLGVNIEEVTESIFTNTRRQNVNTEDVATNTDQPIENTEDAATNTEPLSEFTEEVAATTNTETTEELNGTTEEFDITTEQISETTETLATINDPLSAPSEEFDVNTERSDIIIHFETNAEEPSEDIENSELLSKSSEKLDLNSSKEVNVILLSEEIEKTEETNEEGNQSKEQIEFTIINKSESVSTSLTSTEGIEQTEESNEGGNQLKEQTESSEDSLGDTLNQQD